MVSETKIFKHFPDKDLCCSGHFLSVPKTNVNDQPTKRALKLRQSNCMIDCGDHAEY